MSRQKYLKLKLPNKESVNKENELKESESRFKTLFEQAGDGIYLLNSEGKIVDANQIACRNLGYSRKELLNLSVPEISIHYPSNKFLEVFNKLKNQSFVTIETEQRKKDGSLFPVEIRSSYIKLAGIPHLLSLVRDITERKQTEDQLLKMSSAIEQTGDNVIITNIDGIIEYVNVAFEKLTGYSRDKVIGKTPRILKSGLHNKVFYENLWNSILKGRIYRGEFANRKKNGEIYYEEKTITPIKDNEGNITHFISTGKDLSERKLAEEKLKINEDRFRRLYNKTPVMLHSINREGKIIGVSDFWCKKMGYSRKEVLGKKSINFLTENSQLFAEKLALPKFFKNGHANNVEFQFVKKDGKLLDILLSAISEKSDNNKFIQSYAVANDITDLKKAESKRSEALVLAEKAAKYTSLGTLAAGISHEINQPLTAMKIRADGLLMRDFESKSFKVSTIKEHLIFISEQVSRIDDIINQMRILASKREISLVEEVNINNIIENSLVLMKERASAKGIKFKLNLRKDIPCFIGHNTSMQQVIINLVNNAMDVLEEYDNKNKNIDISTYFKENDLRIIIKDNGPGINEQDIDNLFDPFFTTKKKSGEGMGIGLTITKQIIDSFGGHIKAENNKIRGACFTVTIPA